MSAYEETMAYRGTGSWMATFISKALGEGSGDMQGPCQSEFVFEMEHGSERGLGRSLYYDTLS